MKSILILLACAAGPAFATTVRFVRDQRPAEMVEAIQVAAAARFKNVYFDHQDHVLQIWGELDLHLPTLPRGSRGRFLRDLRDALEGGRFGKWALLLKHARVRVRDGAGLDVDWRALDFSVHRVKITVDAGEPLMQLFGNFPLRHRHGSSTHATWKITGAFEIDLSDFAPAMRRGVRRQFEDVFNGDETVRGRLRVDAGDAAIVFLPDDLAPISLAESSGAGPRLQHHLIQIAMRFGMTLDQAVFKTLVDLESWMSLNYRPGHELLLEFDETAVDVARRAEFRRTFQSMLNLGRLPRGFKILPGKIKLVPSGANQAQVLNCQTPLQVP